MSAGPSPGEKGTSPRSRAAALTAAILVAAAAASLAVVVRVPVGHQGLRRARGGAGWDLLAPGLHLRVPLLHQVVVGPDRLEAEERLSLATREGASVQVRYAASGRMPAETLARAASRGLAPLELLEGTARAGLRDALVRHPGDLVARGGSDAALARDVAASLETAGFEAVSVEVSAGGSDRNAEAPPPRRLEHPIVVIGLDGADWQAAEPLIEAGRLPVLAGLRERGAWAHLRSSAPMLSPLLWTTAVTGKPPDEHGIVDFLVPDPATGRKVPISSAHRRVKALWSLFSERGLTSGVVAWWATFPAEPIRGAVVSDRVAYSLFDVADAAGGVGLVHPPELLERIRGLTAGPAGVSDGEVTRIARVSAAQIARAREAAGRKGVSASRDRLVHLLKILAAAKTYHAAALDLLRGGQPDLFALYYQGIDEVSHRFAHCAPPALPICPPEDAERYGGAVAAFYEWQDGLLGEVLANVDPGSRVLVLSDHGFRNGGDRPRDEAPDIEGKPAKWHRLYGIAILAGPGIRPGRLDTATLLDVTPTVLRLAGLPQAADMPGRPLVDPGGASPPATIATYEGPPAAPALASSEPAIPAAGEEEMLENLRSLGYIGGDAGAPPPPSTDHEAGSTPATLTAHTNVGALELQKGNLPAAAREFEAALRLSSNYFPALMGLAEVRIREGRLDEALALTRRGMESSPSPEPGVYLRFAGLSLKTGRAEEAEAALLGLRTSRPKAAEIPVALAVLAQDAGRAGEAETLLLKAIDLDPSGTEAMSRLYQMRRKSGAEGSLEPAIRRALAANPGSVMHRNWLGLILERRGDLAGAEREFKAAMEAAPDFGGTMANLGSLYGKRGRLEEAVTVLRRALRIEPDNLEARVNLGAALGKLGRPDEALEVMQQGHDASRPSPELLNAMAVAWAQKGQARRAGDLLRESLALRPDQPGIREMLEQLGQDR